MAIRGVYTPEEEKLIAEWKERSEGGSFWVGDDPRPEEMATVRHRVVTRELIVNMANSIGDRNPLYHDERYARGTRWGGIIAPPLFPYVICGFGPVTNLKVPASVGSYNECTAGYRWEFFKPMRIGDSYRVRERVAPTMSDLTRLDGKGPRWLIFTYDKRFINQNDEVVCIAHSKRSSLITAPEEQITDTFTSHAAETPILPLLPFTAYKYTRAELEYFDRVYDEEEVRGTKTRFWDDVDIGDELKPIVIGPITSHDYLPYFSNWFETVQREQSKKNPRMVIKDPETGIGYSPGDWHLIDRVAELVGARIAVAGTIRINQTMSRVVTDWMGDDAFMKVFDSNHWTIVPMGDTYLCKGKVIKKKVENGEHLVDVSVWVESVRGYIAMWGTATVCLSTKQEAGHATIL